MYSTNSRKTIFNGPGTEGAKFYKSIVSQPHVTNSSLVTSDSNSRQILGQGTFGIVFVEVSGLNGCQLAKIKKCIPETHGPCHEIYRDETVGLKSCKNT